jgi:hypothetical protein
MLNILMLHKHLIDYTKLGVIDQRFIERSIRILVAVLTDSDCSKHMDVRRRAMEVLTAFLQGMFLFRNWRHRPLTPSRTTAKFGCILRRARPVRVMHGHLLPRRH